MDWKNYNQIARKLEELYPKDLRKSVTFARLKFKNRKDESDRI